MDYKLPKIWMGRIQKYWDKFIPKGFPVSSSKFSLKYETEEIKEAVDKMEASIGTEESVLSTVVPEDSFLSEYLGVYDVIGTPGELTLLSPVKVNSENIIAVHYNAESDTWDKIEDIQIIDGYVWGTLESFSPIAIFKYAKEIHIETEVKGIKECKSFVVCEGNPVRVTYRDGKSYVLNTASGKEIEVSTRYTYLIGGSIDGSHVESTSITLVDEITSSYISKVIAGSVYNETDGTFATVGSVNLYMKHSALGGLTGSMGAVRTEEVNFNINTNSVVSFLGAGEAFAKVNTPPTSFASNGWVKKVNYNFNDSKLPLTFLGGNNEYFYVDNTFASIDNCRMDYLISGGSNDGTNESEIIVTNSNIGIYQSTNRGNVKSAKVKFTDCIVKNLYVGGDASDNTVTGTTENIIIEINAGLGSYNIVPGTEKGKQITSEDAERIVKYVKVSRNTNVTISDELKEILGSKYIVK